jgi:hypothetical protein
MSKDSYFIIGKCDYDAGKAFLGGEIDADETITDNIMFIEGTMGDSRTNQSRKVKGFLKNDLTLDKMVTFMAFEYPIKKDASNKAYFLMLDLSEADNPKSDEVQGEYEGMIFTGVKLPFMKKAFIDSLEVPHAELFAALINMDFNYKNQKEFSAKMEIQKYDISENNAA